MPTQRGEGPAAVHRYGPDPRQFAELWLPASTNRRPGTVVVVHGGFWRSRYTLDLGRPLAADLVGRGWAVWNLEYRTAGSGGGWPATFTDVAAGIDALAHVSDVDPEPVVAIGHSAGAHLATWAASRPNLPHGAPGARPQVTVSAVVAQAGVLALAKAARERVGNGAVIDLMGGPPDDLPDAYGVADPIMLVPPPVPVLCVHSRRDESVPYSQSEAYVAAAGGHARLRETRGDHFTLIDPGHRDWSLVVDALPALIDG